MRQPVLVLLSCFVFLKSTLAQTQTSKAPPIPAAHSGVLGDYVPCLFDQSEEFSFRSLTVDPPLVFAPQAQAIQQKFKSLFPESTITDEQLANKPLTTVIDTLQKEIYARSIAATPSEKTAAQTYLATGITQPTNNWPPDVSCSVSFLQWKETSDDFGRRVSNQYVALQVNIRNLSTTSEFLVHDIQVAVDTFANTKSFARFQASRDKLIVRAVAQRGQTEDRRNLILNSLVLVGAVGGGANAALQAARPGVASTSALSTAVAIFQGAIIPGFSNIFPDHTVEQINHINDQTFSASSTSKTVVPVQGSVPLVTFISERPLEQMPFANCGTAKIDKSLCQDTAELSDEPLPVQSFLKPLQYKKWDAAALRVLQARTYVVVGGVHITEASAAASLTEMDCPTFADETANLSTITGGALACTIKGSHLEKVLKVSLKLGSNEISGSIQASKDGSTATALFTEDTQLDSANGIFALYLTDATGNVSQTGATLKFGLRKIKLNEVASVPAATAVVLSAPLVVTLTGANLDRIKSVTLKNAAGTSISARLDAPMPYGGTSGDDVGQKRTATFSASDLATLKTGPATLAVNSFTPDDDTPAVPPAATTYTVEAH